MKRELHIICWLLLLGFVLRVDATENWPTNLPNALAEAKEIDRPVLVYFTAPWCGPCRVMKQTTLVDPKVNERIAGFIKVTLDFDTNPDAVKQFSIQGIPAFVVLSSSGEPVLKNIGYMDATQFERRLTDGMAAAAFAVAQQKAFAENVSHLEKFLQSSSEEERAKAISQLFDLCGSSKPAAREYAVKKITELGDTNPQVLANGLSHEKLAVRIEMARLLHKKFGDKFQFDPWLSRPDRLEAVEKVKRTLSLTN